MEFREDRRRKAYMENLEKIRAHNEAYKEGKYSFKLSTNNLADLSNQQYLRHYVRLINSEINEDRDYILGNSQFENKEYPPTLDWREKGFVTRAKNQKSCGSCYSFSITHSIEGQLFKRLNRIIELSTQQIVDCSSSFGNHGCAGGSLRTTLKYLESSGGLMREEDYPYVASVSCNFNVL
jgi:cathepsin L